MIFVIPMAGESRRFYEAGYAEPKYRLMVGHRSVFAHAVGSFVHYFRTDAFIFIVRDADAAEFVRHETKTLGIEQATIVALDRPTAGQAETVLLGLDRAETPDDRSIAIFNIDTFRPGYRAPAPVADPSCAGYVEVFRGEGAGWSFVAPHPEHPGEAAYVVEKDQVSDLCSTGLYYFRRAGDFRWAYHHPEPPRSAAERKERYVAPLYNALIARGDRIAFELIAASEVIFCGTPEQYEQLRDRA